MKNDKQILIMQSSLNKEVKNDAVHMNWTRPLKHTKIVVLLLMLIWKSRTIISNKILVRL